MKIFKEETDFRRDRNRHFRWGGWGGLVIKVLVLVFVIMAFRSCNKENVENIMWFFKSGSGVENGR